MTVGGHPLRWLPPFVVGVCAAIAAEIAVGLLLYSGPGLMRSLTAILGVEAAALGFGLWTAPGPRPDVVESLRRRWLFCLTTFLLATVFSAFWSVVQAVGGSGLGQGLGLAFMAGLPLYASGGLLGAMATVGTTDPTARHGGVGAAAALGAALGFAATGISLPRAFTPASLLLVCLVLLSAGGLVYGSVLDARLHVHVRARRPSGLGDVRVEDRHLLSRDRAARFLLEGGFVRAWMTLMEDGEEPWDVVLFRALRDGWDGPGRILLVGGGASALTRAAVREDPTVTVDVAERSAAVVELGREHLETGLHGDAEGRIVLRVGNVEDTVATLWGPYRAIFVDVAAFQPVGGLGVLSDGSRRRLFAGLAAGGALVVGPVPPEAGTWTFPAGWSSAAYRRTVPAGVDWLGAGVAGQEVVTLGRPGTGGVWPERLGSFVREAEARA